MGARFGTLRANSVKDGILRPTIAAYNDIPLFEFGCTHSLQTITRVGIDHANLDIADVSHSRITPNPVFASSHGCIVSIVFCQVHFRIHSHSSLPLFRAVSGLIYSNFV